MLSGSKSLPGPMLTKLYDAFNCLMVSSGLNELMKISYRNIQVQSRATGFHCVKSTNKISLLLQLWSYKNEQWKDILSPADFLVKKSLPIMMLSFCSSFSYAIMIQFYKFCAIGKIYGICLIQEWNLNEINLKIYWHTIYKSVKVWLHFLFGFTPFPSIHLT